MQWSTDDGRSDVDVCAGVDQQFDHFHVAAEQCKVKRRGLLYGRRGEDVASIGAVVQQQADNVDVVAEDGVVEDAAVVVAF